MNEVLAEPRVKKKCLEGKEKEPIPKPEEPKPRDPPISSQITPEQLLSLITEYNISEKKNPDLTFSDQEFWEKLKTSYLKDRNYQTAVNKSLRLHKEYFSKLEKFSNSQMPTCITCHKKASGGYMTDDGRFICSDECYQKAVEKARKGEIQGWKEALRCIGRDQNDEQKRKLLYQEYQNKFQKITSSISSLTQEVLMNLESFGYFIQETKWTSELQAPSLTIEDDYWHFIKAGVSFRLGKK